MMPNYDDGPEPGWGYYVCGGVAILVTFGLVALIGTFGHDVILLMGRGWARMFNK